MRVKDAIKQLEKMPEDEEIIIAYWTKEFFEGITENIGYVYEGVPAMTKEEWNRLVAICDSELTWDYVFEDIEALGLDNWDTIRPRE